MVTLSTRSPASISDEGRHARDRGDPVTANPYPTGSDEHRIWERGYRIPDAEAQAATPKAGTADEAG
jgi:hypothetical protein